MLRPFQALLLLTRYLPTLLASLLNPIFIRLRRIVDGDAPACCPCLSVCHLSTGEKLIRTRSVFAIPPNPPFWLVSRNTKGHQSWCRGDCSPLHLFVRLAPHSPDLSVRLRLGSPFRTGLASSRPASHFVGPSGLASLAGCGIHQAGSFLTRILTHERNRGVDVRKGKEARCKAVASREIPAHAHVLDESSVSVELNPRIDLRPRVDRRRGGSASLLQERAGAVANVDRALEELDAATIRLKNLNLRKRSKCVLVKVVDGLCKTCRLGDAESGCRSNSRLIVGLARPLREDRILDLENLLGTLEVAVIRRL